MSLTTAIVLDSLLTSNFMVLHKHTNALQVLLCKILFEAFALPRHYHFYVRVSLNSAYLLVGRLWGEREREREREGRRERERERERKKERERERM